MTGHTLEWQQLVIVMSTAQPQPLRHFSSRGEQTSGPNERKTAITRGSLALHTINTHQHEERTLLPSKSMRDRSTDVKREGPVSSQGLSPC